MKKRLLFYSLQKYLDHKNALIITGLRQVGKTTLLKQLFEEIKSPHKLWFDFDNPLDQKMFEDIDYNNIYKKLCHQAQKKENERLFIFLDEIQNLPEITKIIKYLIDHYQVKFVVTGSSQFYLKNLFPESLSGRKFLSILPPLGFQEFLYFKDKISLDEAREKKDFSKKIKPLDIIDFKKYELLYDEFMTFGGFPEVIFTKDIDTKKKVLKNIFASFFEKDLRILSDYKNIRELRDLILLLVPRIGSMLDITRLSSELSINRAKVYEYLAFLQGTFFLKLLPKFSKQPKTSFGSGGKKVYFTDTGLLSVLGLVNEAQLFENTVVNQVSEYGEISFYNKRNTAEIDIILEKNYALEVKLTGTSNDAEKTKKISQKIEIPNALVVSKNWREDLGVIHPFLF